MKKVKLFTAFILIISMLMCFPACGPKGIDSPTGWSIDEDNKLTWEKVANARRYLVQVVNVATQEVVVEKESIRSYYSLAGLEEGDYEIRIMAISGNSDYANSEWSDTIAFHKDYESGLVYSLINNNTEYEIVQIGKAKGSVIIEDVYRGKPVTKIGERAFGGRGNSGIYEVHLGKNIKTISEFAFVNCSALTTINLDNVETIGAHAFQSCRSLNNITLPDTITTIEPYTFAYCAGMSNFNMGNSVASIGEYAFVGCIGLTSFTFSDSVETMGNNVFQNCNALEEVTFGDALTNVAQYAFLNAKSLETVNFADAGNLTIIDEFAFQNCYAMESITIPEGVTEIRNQAFDMGNLKEVKPTPPETSETPEEGEGTEGEGTETVEPEPVYTTESKLVNVELPESLTSLGQWVFNGTKLHLDQKKDGFIYVDHWLTYVEKSTRTSLVRLTTDTLQEGVVGLAARAFMESSLENVVLPSTLKYIGEYSFGKCTNLYSFRANKNLISIGDYAFAYDSFLSVLQLTYYPDMKLESIGNYAFGGCTQLDNAANNVSMLPNSLKKIGTSAFTATKLWDSVEDGNVVYAGNWLVGFKMETQTNALGWVSVPNPIDKVELKEGTRGISNYALYQCITLTSVSGMNDVYYIGKGAFYGCSDLITAPLNSNITKIEDYTFYKCESLTRTSFPVTLREIGNSAFSGCTNLVDVDLSKARVTTIGDYAFSKAHNVRSVKLGDDLQHIGERAFYNNYLLETLIMPDTVTYVGANAFSKCEKLSKVTLSNQLTELPDNIFYGCLALEEIVIPEKVTSIGNYAFYKCEALKSVEFSPVLTTIGKYAFAKDKSLTSVVLPDTVNFIGAYAFRGCEGLTSIKISKEINEVGLHAFYGCKNLTIFTDAEQGKWIAHWNSSNRPVCWETTFSEDGEYVVSVTKDSITNPTAKNATFLPAREGYTLVGWTTVKDSAAVEYAPEFFSAAPDGVTLYAVWQANA